MARLEANNNIQVARGVVKLSNGTLFLRQKGAGQEQFAYLCGEKKLSSNVINNFITNIVHNSNYCTERAIAYRHIVFPAKPVAYKAMLSNYSIDIKPIFDNMKHGHRDVYYPKLEDLKETFYYKDDTHCSFEGSHFIIGNTLKYIGYDISKYGFTLEDKKRQGDLGSMLKLPPEVVPTLTKFEEYDKAGIMYSLKDALEKNSGEIVFNFNPHAPIKKRILLFGDSFFVGALNWLRYLFEEVVYLRSTYILTDVANNLMPDIILTGNAERYLTNVASFSNHTPYFTNYFSRSFSPNKLSHDTMTAFKALFSGRDSNEYNEWKSTFNYKELINLPDVELYRLMARYPKLVDDVRDYAIKIEFFNLKQALRLMTLCSKVRPKGPYIKVKLEEYEMRLEGSRPSI